MARIEHISDDALNNLVRKKLKENGFLTDEPENVPQKNKSFEISKKEIKFLKDILVNVSGDSEEENEMLLKLNNTLSNCLENR